MEIINTRRSVRTFQTKEVEKEKIELMLRAAMQAPSARNQQPWHFLVISKRETLTKLSEISPYNKMLKEAPLAIILLIDKESIISPGMHIQDMSAAMENMMLEARSLGLGTCWMGTYPREDRMGAVIEVFNLPEKYEPFAICAIGYPKDADAFKFIDRYNASRVHFEEI